ncbi:MAG TPA: hypothetical protein VKT77_05765 [Chthonomonadaceae bacterium]|nr:hypothetical protein [Chthonomonadaceae bacterium]
MMKSGVGFALCAAPLLACAMAQALTRGVQREEGVSSSTAATVADVARAIDRSGFAAAHPGVTVTRDGNTVTIAYHTRSWLVYTAGMDGTWSKEPRNETGPDTDGFLITVSVAPMRDEAEQVSFREHGMALKGLIEEEKTGQSAHLLRYPYWTVYGCDLDLPARGQRLFFNVEINHRTNRPLLRKALALVARAFEPRQAAPARRP